MTLPFASGLPCFNPRSPPKRGATRKAVRSVGAARFQSTLPSEERSDNPKPTDGGRFREFQSTLPSEERSDSVLLGDSVPPT